MIWVCWPKKAAQRLAHDRKLQNRVETSAAELQKALAAVLHEPEKKRGVGRVIRPVLVVGGAAAAVFVVLRKRSKRGIGPDDTPY